MKELLPDIERWRDAGQKVAIATVVQAYGSAPRRAGAKMAIAEDGEFVGSVSGGCVENDVVAHAQQVLEENHPRLVPYGISDELAFNVGLACGGQIEVFIQPFEQAVPTEKPVAFAYAVDGDNQGNGLLAWELGEHDGTLGRGEAFDERVAADALARLRDGTAGQLRYDDAPGGPLRVFVDTYPAQPTIVIFGGVHIGVALAQLAKVVGGFRVVVVDARGAWASPARFALADEIHVMHADDYLRQHPLGSNAYVAVLSHDPKLDDPALFGALQSGARYVGAIGSPKTQRERRERLGAAGLTQEQLARIHGPIGLDIGAQSPEEIAVAVLAQMIAAKAANRPLNGGRRKPRWRSLSRSSGSDEKSSVLAAVILAAGGSSRMGQPKQLLMFRGTSLLRRAIDTALAVPVDQVIVVLGFAADQLLPVVKATGATVVLNDQWSEGVSTSLRGGLSAVPSDARGVFIYPADMPLVTPEALRELARRQQVSGRPAAMTEAGGVRGVPVFITRSLFPALMIQEGDAGGAQYLRGHPESVEAVRFDDPDLIRDVDLPEDYTRLLELDPDAELA